MNSVRSEITHSHETEPTIYPMLFVNDFDRTLVKTDELAQAIYSVVNQKTGISIEALKNSQLAQQKTVNGEIDMWAEIVRLSPDIDHQALQAEIIHTVRANNNQFWLDGAREFCRLQEQSGLPALIVTTGSEPWQRTKIACMELDDRPVLITKTKQKSTIINQWFDQEKRQFILPSELFGGRLIAVQHVLLTDDRAAAFEGLVDAAYGIWVKTGRDTSGIVPDSVKEFSSLPDGALSYVEQLVA